jgi:anti-anti-sigma factor
VPSHSKGLPVLDSAVHAHSARARALEATLPAAAPAPALAATIHADRDTVTVVPAGELDVATVPVLDGDLCAVRDLGFDAIVVDLRGLTFIDSTGVHLLVRWAASAAARGCTFRLIPGSDRIQLVFRLTGLLGALDFERPRDAA